MLEAGERKSDRGSDQCSIPNVQFSSEVDVGLKTFQGPTTLPNRFSFRMRIGHWELNIGQILPSMHLREPLSSLIP
jgi:hypothetical protein